MGEARRSKGKTFEERKAFAVARNEKLAIERQILLEKRVDAELEKEVALKNARSDEKVTADYKSFTFVEKQRFLQLLRTDRIQYVQNQTESQQSLVMARRGLSRARHYPGLAMAAALAMSASSLSR